MTELDDLLRFINTSAFASLSSDAQKEMLKKVESFKAMKRESQIKDLAEKIANNVESLIKGSDFTASYYIKIIGEKVNISIAQNQETISLPNPKIIYPYSNDTECHLTVIFKDGDMVYGKSYIDTFIKSLKKIGLEHIPDLNITFGNINLVSKIQKDASKQTYVDGMYVYVDLNENEVRSVLEDISERLYLNLLVKINNQDVITLEDSSDLASIIASEYPNYTGIICRKVLDWSFLNRGFTIPKVYITAALTAYGKDLITSKSEEITVIFNHKQYKVKLLKASKSVIQMLWSTSGILDDLRQYCHNSYLYMKAYRQNSNSRKRVKLPMALRRSFYLCTTTTKGVFILYPANNNQESNHISTSTINNTALYKTKSCNHIVLESLKWLRANDSLEKLCPFIVKNPYKPNIKLKKEGDFNLANIFLESSTEDLKARNAETIRWFSIPFTIGGAIMYPSTQWRNNGQGGLQLSEFMKMIDYVFPNTIKIVEYGNSYQLIDIRTSPQTSTQTNR